MNRLNVDRLAEVLSEILSEKHGARVTISFTPRAEANESANSDLPVKALDNTA